MEFQTLYFDLTNEEDVKTITSSSIHDLLLSQETEETTGATSPFYIILKMNGLFRKKKPEFWKLLNKFQETPFPLKFITVFVDKSPSDSRPVIHLSQELQKDNVRIFWIQDPRGLEIDGQAVPRAIGRWEGDPTGNLALNEFIEILKIPEVFHDTMETSEGQKVYIPGYKKLRVGFGDEKDNFDVFFKAINSVTGNINPANLPAITFNKPSEMIIGSDLTGADFIEDKGLLAENIEQILRTQRQLLYMFGISNDKKSSRYKNMLNRVSISTDTFQEKLQELSEEITQKIDELAEKLSSVDSLSGLSNDDINKLSEIGINITAKSSEIENQQDQIASSVWSEMLQNLQNGYSFEALIPNLETEISSLTPKDNEEIIEKVSEVKKATIFSNLNDISAHIPKFLSSLLGGIWTKLLLVRNYIITGIVFSALIFGNIQVSQSRDLCTEALGYDLSEYNNVEFVLEFIRDTNVNNIPAKKCRAALPTADLDFYFDYDEFSEYKTNLAIYKEARANGEITADEFNDFIIEYNAQMRSYNSKVNTVNNLLYVILTLSVPLLLYVLLTIVSIGLLFYTNALIRTWGNNLGLKQLDNISKKLKLNVEELVLNDIKFGQLRKNLASQLNLYKELVEEIQVYVENSQDTFMSLEIDSSDIDEKSSELVNPKYVQKVTPIAQGQNQGMFDRVVSISRDELVDIIKISSENNIVKLFGRNPELFKENVFNDFEEKLLNYISIIKTKGILELDDSSNEETNLKKEELRSEIWKNDSIIKEPLEEIILASKNTITMQMISPDDIELLDKQNTQWRFLTFLPKKTIDWFNILENDRSDSHTLTESTETAGYLRLIPVNRNSMDVV